MNRLEWSALDEDARRAALLRPVQQVAEATRASVAGLIEEVRTGGDAALRAITLRFDKVSLENFEVSDAEFSAAESEVASELKLAMQQAVASGSYGIHALLYARFRQAEHDQRV